MTSPRRAGLAAILALAVLLGIDTVAWFWATGRLLVGWETWRAQALAGGVAVQSAPPVRGGWPFTADIALGATSVDAGLATWRADMVRLTLSVFHPLSLALTVHGGESLRLDGLPPIAMTARGLAVTVPLDDPERVSFEGHSITAILGGGTLEIGVLAGSAGPEGIDLALSHLSVPAAGLPFGGAIDHASAHLHTTVPVSRGVADGTQTDPARAAAAWAHAGGQVVVDEAAVRWGALDAQGHFTAGLDEKLQPTVNGTLHVVGYHEAIDALVRAGTIGRNAARVATTVLDMMATSTQPAVVDVPLTLQGGTLAMGAIPLARIPPLTWP